MRKQLHTINGNNLERFTKETLFFVGHKDDANYLDRFNKEDMIKLYDYFGEKLKAIQKEIHQHKGNAAKISESHQAEKMLHRIQLTIENKVGTDFFQQSS